MAQVPLTYNYVSLGPSGPHERRPVRTPGGPGGLILIEQKSGGTLQTGDVFQIGVPLPATQTFHGATLNFWFVNVSGGQPSGSQVSFDNLNPPPFVTVESAPIDVLVLYVPTGGSGGRPGSGTPGATIDSFDETTGSLFNDIFVSVSPDPGGELTSSANDLGFVSTAANEEAITALSPTSSGVVFDQWNVFAPPGASTPRPGAGRAPVNVDGRVLTVAKDTSAIALAFYKAPSREQQLCTDAARSFQNIIQHRDLPRLTAAQLNDMRATLERCVREGFLTQAFVDQLFKEYQETLQDNPPNLPKP
jgi:hypothetical protein